MKARSLKDRFAEKWMPGEDGCWQWTGAIELSQGYGQIRTGGPGGGRRTRAHRVAYELYVGPIPEGLQIDHLCRNRGCVNPSHLEAVDSRTNTLRGEGISAQYARRTICGKGHSLEGENLYWATPKNANRPVRQCRECSREKRRAWERTRPPRKRNRRR